MNSTTNPLQIIIADDHEITRYGIRVMLNTQSHIRIVAEACNGLELVALTRQYHPDIVLTDLEMPEMGGLEATRIIAKEQPGITIIALSMYDDVYSIIDILEAGAMGYLLKNADKEETLRAISTVKNTGSYYFGGPDVRLINLVMAGKYAPDSKNEIKFTEREHEVVNLLCRELTSKQIAAALDLSIRTVEGYRENIMEKTGANNNVGIAMFAVRNKIYIP